MVGCNILTVILLNGASGSGKSTLAKSLQKYIKSIKNEYKLIKVQITAYGLILQFRKSRFTHNSILSWK